jgi:amino acid transporter
MGGEDGNGTEAPQAKKSSFVRLVSAVLWSFFGVRKRRDLEADAALNPLHLIVAGLIGAALFVIVLLVIVHLVVG